MTHLYDAHFQGISPKWKLLQQNVLYYFDRVDARASESLYIIYCRSLPYTFEEDQNLVIFLGMLMGITSKVFSAICY